MMEPMPKRSSRKRDFMEGAHSVVEQAIGEQMDGTPLKSEVDSRNLLKALAGTR
jgi:hypothetical protein